jgi:thioesterase domain-containing protein
MDQNPAIIQKPRRKTLQEATNREPLFLIHDGGGTIFSYFLLGPLGRPVYGIANPFFGTDEVWPNGIASMAEHYAELIKRTISSGNILLAGEYDFRHGIPRSELIIGWSLGGLIAIEIAHLLSNESDLRVKGILLIDSSYPMKGKGMKQREITFKPQASTTPEMTSKISKAMDEARIMMRNWDPPEWAKQNNQQVESIENNTHTHHSLKRKLPSCPGVVLLRAATASSEESKNGHQQSDDSFSGFDSYENFHLHSVINIPGDHFSIFETPNVRSLYKFVPLMHDLTGTTGDFTDSESEA